MRRLVVNSIVVAFVLPLRIAAWAAGGLGADRSATRLRALMAGVPIAAYVVTGTPAAMSARNRFHAGRGLPV
jgi:hypothetical protein